jgi:hypothetical protein
MALVLIRLVYLYMVRVFIWLVLRPRSDAVKGRGRPIQSACAGFGRTPIAGMTAMAVIPRARRRHVRRRARPLASAGCGFESSEGNIFIFWALFRGSCGPRGRGFG